MINPLPTTIKVPQTRRSAFQMQVKRTIQFAVFFYVLPRLIVFHIANFCFGRRAISGASESIAKLPGIRGVYARQAFYRSVLHECGNDFSIGWGTVFSMREAKIGDRAYIGRNCSIGFADIGTEALLADNVTILSGGHEHDTEGEHSIHSQPHTYTQVVIGFGAWIGTGAVIMADVGEHAIVGAGAVVNRPIPKGAIAVGVPAKVVRWRYGWDSSGRMQSASSKETI